MTFIEFFEKDAIENICSSLAKAPERVFLIGDKQKLMQKHAERYKAILQARGVEVEFICRAVNKNKIQTIIDALSAIVEEYDDCVFDLTGGEDLYLVATGIVFEKYKDRNIQMHRFNIRNNTIVDGDQDGQTILTEQGPELSVEENIRIFGGDIIYDDCQEDKTCRWDMNADFREDINSMWEICCKDTRLWNTQICVLETAEKLTGRTDDLKIKIPTDYLINTVERNGGSYVNNRRIMNGLYHAGLLTAYSVDDDMFSIAFKNEQVKYCLTVAGQVLEMRVFLAALEAQESDGSKTYNDAMNGVCIDWDGNISHDQSGYDTENEIDVIMMHGMVPVFVSCKNGCVDKEELYKLNAVATRFGGKYVKKVLIATSLDGSDYSNYLRQRAKDMGIRLVEGYSHNGVYKDFTDMDKDDINRVIRSLWSN